MTASINSNVNESSHIDGDALPHGTPLLGGQYIIEKYLSSGGFGITYLAQDSLERRVVIKECFPEALCRRHTKTVRARSQTHENGYQSLVAMFVREARSLAKLSHPNIVGVHQVFEDNETAYMALDLIEGEDLLFKLERGDTTFAPEVICGFLRRLLDAVETVHSADMLHRDISPDNILLSWNGDPILIDFGAAREHASKKSRAISALLVVKDGYSPQEFYISGGLQGPWSDLYSLAATFVHLITGEAPPDSQSRIAALAAKRADPYVPLCGRIDGYEEAFLRAIDQTMSVFPQDRLQSAADWFAALDDVPPRFGAPQTEQDLTDLLKVVAELVSDVDIGLKEDRETDELTAAPDDMKDVQPPEKVWEYLLPEEPAEDETPYNMAQRRRCDDLAVQAAPCGRNRRAPRRSSVLFLLVAVSYAISEDPSETIALATGSDIQQLIDLVRDWTAHAADMVKSII